MILEIQVMNWINLAYEKEQERRTVEFFPSVKKILEFIVGINEDTEVVLEGLRSIVSMIDLVYSEGDLLGELDKVTPYDFVSDICYALPIRKIPDFFNDILKENEGDYRLADTIMGMIYMNSNSTGEEYSKCLDRTMKNNNLTLDYKYLELLSFIHESMVERIDTVFEHSILIHLRENPSEPNHSEYMSIFRSMLLDVDMSYNDLIYLYLELCRYQGGHNAIVTIVNILVSDVIFPPQGKDIHHLLQHLILHKQTSLAILSILGKVHSSVLGYCTKDNNEVKYNTGVTHKVFRTHTHLLHILHSLLPIMNNASDTTFVEFLRELEDSNN